MRDSGEGVISSGMTRIFDMDDRARLRERFYGEARSVLARL
ncbi:isopropylmalate isomerase [Shimia sediminis]|nr:isopropylmalate isomerase [Shimia sediminis]